MNKAELSSLVSGPASLTRSPADRDVGGTVFSAIGEALAKDEPVTIAGFGTFATKRRPARPGRNPRTGESITTAASTPPSFKAGKALRDAVNRHAE